MLQGLRLLLGQATAKEKLEALAGHAVDAIKGAAHLVLQVGRDGTPRPLASDAPPLAGGNALADLFQSQLSPVTTHKDGGDYTARLRALLGTQSGDIAVIFLPEASESMALICAPRRAQGFLPEDVGFASRFALILKQALVLKDEQDKLLQSGKLSALGQMSASLAHELRQPLNTISVAAQNLEMMAEKGPVAPDVLNPKINRILEQVERASQIMDRIRRFSRKSGGLFAEADLTELAEGVRLLMEHVLMPAGVRAGYRGRAEPESAMRRRPDRAGACQPGAQCDGCARGHRQCAQDRKWCHHHPRTPHGEWRRATGRG